MATDRDVIVVGGWLAGLTAAARLARAGLGVRLLERHVQPVGYTTTFYRDAHELEIALHEPSGNGPPAHRWSLRRVPEQPGVVP